MRVVLLGLIIAVLGAMKISAQCTYQLELYDTYGDGFNGGTVSVLVNSTAVLTDVTIESGSGPELHSFTINSGDEIDVVYTEGGFPEENEIRIYDSEGIVAFEDGIGGTTPIGGAAEVGSCPVCYAPTDIVISNIDVSSADISWSDDLVTEWHLEYGPKGYIPGEGTLVPNLTAKSYQIQGLVELTEYEVYIQSNCAADDGSKWRKAEFKTLPSCWVPNIYNITDITTNSMTVMWSENGSATLWDIEYVKDSESFTGTPTVTDISVQSYTLLNLEPYTSYKMRIRANCGAGDYSLWSGSYIIQTLPTCRIPSLIDEQNITETSADIVWTENGDATEWEIELIKSSETFNGVPNITGITENPYTAENLELYTKYIYIIRANCGDGDVSPWGYGNEFTTLTNYPVPEITTINNITVISADVSWVENGVATQWDIEVVKASGSFTGTPTASQLTSTTYSCQNLESSTKYMVKVRANAGNGETSPWSEVIYFVTEMAQISNGSCGINYGVYDLYSSIVPIGVLEEGILGTDVQLKAVNLVIEHTYVEDLEISLKSPGGQEVLLSSENGGSGTDYGDTESACLTYSSFMMTGEDGSITDASAPFIGSYVPEGDFSDFNDDVTNSKGRWELVISDGVDGDEGSLIYAELVFEDLNPTSIHDEESTFGEKLKVYPNPAKEYLNVQLDLENRVEDIQLVLTDLSGKQVFNQQYPSLSQLNERIELMNLNKGMYFLNVNTNNKSQIVKVIVK